MKKNKPFFNFQQPANHGDSQNYYTTDYAHLQLSTAALRSSQKYQRRVRQERVQQIIDNFNPLYLDEIIVSFRDGAYYVVDGQNRIAAFKQMNKGAHCKVNCKVYSGLTYEQEAEMFFHLDNIRGKLKYNEKIQARKESGDPDIQNIARIMSRHGLEWKLNGAGAGGDNAVSSSRTVVDCHDKYGPYVLDTGFGLLVKTWGGDGQSLSAPFIKGICLFVHTYAKDADQDVFVQKLSKFTPGEIKTFARQETIVDRQDMKYARVFLAKYNYNRLAANKLDCRFN